jgi:hypothetical protein
MSLFQILTRRIATGKRKVTQKLIDRVHCETGGKPSSMASPASGKKRRHFARLLCYVAIMGVLALTVCLGIGRAMTVPPPTTNLSGYSAGALFNQANACAREGKTGLAILNYECALLLAPNDADIAANLQFVRTKAGLPAAPGNWFARSSSFARPNSLAWLGSFGLLLAGTSLLLTRLQPQRRWVFGALTVVGALLVATAIGSGITTWPKMNEAVVITSETPARMTPVSTAEATFKLLAGETVTLCGEHQDFALVQSSAGRSGWVSRADIIRVLPQSGIAAPSPNRS